MRIKKKNSIKFVFSNSENVKEHVTSYSCDQPLLATTKQITHFGGGHPQDAPMRVYFVAKYMCQDLMCQSVAPTLFIAATISYSCIGYGHT